eukprot:1283437-Pyramimonas_sp.AAC.1
MEVSTVETAAAATAKHPITVANLRELGYLEDLPALAAALQDLLCSVRLGERLRPNSSSSTPPTTPRSARRPSP